LTEELGDVLWMTAVLARKLGTEPESVLRSACDKFADRFRSMEDQARADGRDLESLSQDQWAEYWSRAKADDAPHHQ
jgi:uncharacterized protein YabN with tetrapyrrole methylase and pyrophosphatase domain